MSIPLTTHTTIQYMQNADIWLIFIADGIYKIGKHRTDRNLSKKYVSSEFARSLLNSDKKVLLGDPFTPGQHPLHANFELYKQ